MEDYKALCFRLFAAVADAVEAIERCDYGRVKALLIAAQQETEEEYLSEE